MSSFYSDGNDFVQTLSISEIRKRLKNDMCTESMRLLLTDELKRRTT